jgi:hypothetical protein
MACSKKGNAPQPVTHNQPGPQAPKNPNDTTLYLTGSYQDGPNSVSPQNPERGFRGEITINAKTLKNVFSGVDYSTNFGDYVLSEFKSQNPGGNLSDSLSMMQVYVYLSNEATTQLSAQTLTNIQYIFDELKRVNVKAVLRFSYDDGVTYEGTNSTGLQYTVQNIQTHLTQLTPILSKNAGQIAVLEAGFVGDWGEWGGNYYSFRNYNDATSTILASILTALPANRFMMVRYPSLKNNALAGSTTAFPFTMTDANRTGYHNDYFTGGQVNNGSDLLPGTQDFSQVGNDNGTYRLWMDGEMPYYHSGTGAYDFSSLIDGMAALNIYGQHRYTSFSIAHDNMESINSVMNNWRQTTLTLQTLANASTKSIPVDSAYFHTKAGSDVPRTYFDYIKDHLGYRLQLKDFTYTHKLSKDSALDINFDITNKGFSNMINSRPVYVALVNDVTKAVTTFPLNNVDAQNWDVTQSSYKVSTKIQLQGSIAPGTYSIGLWLPDAADGLKLNASYAVRLANNEVNYWRDVDGKYLINVVGKLTCY